MENLSNFSDSSAEFENSEKIFQDNQYFMGREKFKYSCNLSLLQIFLYNIAKFSDQSSIILVLSWAF